MRTPHGRELSVRGPKSNSLLREDPVVAFA